MSLFVATPMYGGQCYGAYTDSMMKLVVLTMQRGMGIQYFPIFNESHIDRARNVCVDEFLKTSNCSHLMFIDSDIQFHAGDVFTLLEQDKDIVCGFYPKKCINWKAVTEAVKAGYADENPQILARFSADMVYTPALNDESRELRTIYDLVELHEGGTGFCLIKREVFCRLIDLHPELVYRKTGPKSDTIACLFDAKIDPDESPYKRFLSEDYAFCSLARSEGYKIWLAPWIKLAHHGYYQYVGDVEAIGALHVHMRDVA